MTELKTTEKITLTKSVQSKFELEKINGKWVVFEYETDYLDSNLELTDKEKDDFINEWVNDGYKLIN